MRKLIALLLISIIAVSTVSCGGNAETEETTTSTPVETPGATETETETETEAETYEFFRTDEETFDIYTPYCMLKYPVKWKDTVSTEVYESEGTYSVKFYAVLEWNTIPLFTVTFGQSESGYLLGTLDTEGSVYEVYLTDHSEELPEWLSEANELTYYEMCEDVNVVISKLVYDYGMKM